MIDAINTLPRSERYRPHVIEAHAEHIFDASDIGLEATQNRNRPASECKSVGEISQLVAQCERLARSIDGLHKNAVDALGRELIDMHQFQSTLANFTEAASTCEIGTSEGLDQTRKHRAVAIADAAGEVFVEITGRLPTLTINPTTSKTSGIWFDFLTLVFNVLQVEASPESQARRVKELAKEKYPS
ncbi:hypothetical protein AB9F26_05930 [Falsihalocynthiibacter sp. BN13B15]|uniref:hypothetical protein n=1 Tax=Falsihalocynthiibacter sp. BN13B15 TaxID=3240871 RepID=UPI00350FF4F5